MNTALKAACLAIYLLAIESVQRSRGPLVDGIALTLLFGRLPWMPLEMNS